MFYWDHISYHIPETSVSFAAKILRGPPHTSVSFFMAYRAGFGNLSFTLKGIFHHAPDYYILRNVTNMTAPLTVSGSSESMGNILPSSATY